MFGGLLAGQANFKDGVRDSLIIAMSRREFRQKLATEFGATDIVTARDDDGVAQTEELTKGLGADSAIEAVGTQQSMMQAIRSARHGRSATGASPTTSSCPAKTCSTSTSNCWADPHPFDGSCPIRSIGSGRDRSTRARPSTWRCAGRRRRGLCRRGRTPRDQGSAEAVIRAVPVHRIILRRRNTMERVRAGDTIWTPPGEEHWHGGTANHMMGHVAMLEGTEDGDGTTWLERSRKRTIRTQTQTSSTHPPMCRKEEP